MLRLGQDDGPEGHASMQLGSWLAQVMIACLLLAHRSTYNNIMFRSVWQITDLLVRIYDAIAHLLWAETK